jgi:hypothetical protein
MTIWRMRIACRIPKATNTHTEYVTLIAFQLQQWLDERASMLGYKNIVGLLVTGTNKQVIKFTSRHSTAVRLYPL